MTGTRRELFELRVTSAPRTAAGADLKSNRQPTGITHMPNVIHIEGIGEVYATKLHDAGVPTTEALLEA